MPTVLAALLIAVITLLPALYLIVRATEAGAAGIGSIIFSARTLGLLRSTVLLTISVTSASALIAVCLAWLVTSTDLPLRRLLGTLAPLPLVIPSYVAAFAFIAAFGPGGFLQSLLRPLGVAQVPEIYGFTGAFLVLTLITYPYVFLTVRGALQGLDPSVEEAARTLGERSWGVLRKVILPSLKPAAGAGCLLVALYTLHDFGAVSLLRFDTFTRAIFVSYRGSFDRTTAAVLSLVLVAISLAIVLMESKTRRRAAYYRIHSGGGARRQILPLGRWKWPAFAACLLLFIFALGIPVTAICYWMIKGLQAGTAFDVPALSAWNSVSVSFLAALLITAAAWPVSVLGVRHKSKLSGVFAAVSYTGYALPGVVVALGMVFFGLRAALPLYQTQAILLLGYLVLFLPQAIGALRASLLQINPSLEEAAGTLGSGKTATFRRVVFPLSRPGILMGFALVFLTAMKELPATLLLAPPGFQTLTTKIWSATTAASFGQAAPPALLLILLAALPMALLMTVFGRQVTGLKNAS